MRILIDIGHPAHVHYFKHLTKTFQEKDHHVLFVTRDKDVAVTLLKSYGFNYVNIGKPFKSKLGKLFGLFWFSFRILIISLKFRPDIFLNATFYSAVISRLLKKPHISIEDTFNMESVKMFRPFTDAILTGDFIHPPLGEKEILYSGYQELLYLHPNHFNPDKTILKTLDLNENEPFIIVRFVSWNASHDFGHKGLSLTNKQKAIFEFSRYGKVFISSEGELPKVLQKYKINIPPDRMHDAIAFSSLLFGESATMASEAAVLGVPAVFIDNTGRYYTKEQEYKYGMVYNFSESNEDQTKAIEKALEILKNQFDLSYWKKKKEIMLNDKIDVTEFLVWFVENWPESFKIMKADPDYQARFR